MESEYRVCPQYGGECLTQIVVLNKDAVIAIFTKVISASLTDSLSGECTFEFSVTAAMAANITTEYEVRLINDKTDYSFNIARMSKSLSGGLTICDIICEHKSYELNDEKYTSQNLITAAVSMVHWRLYLMELHFLQENVIYLCRLI